MKSLRSFFLLISALIFLGGCANNNNGLRDACIVGTIGAGSGIGVAVGNGPGLAAGFVGGVLAASFICGDDSPVMQVVDSDGDGVTDNNDECPNTPEGVVVDNRGCPRDDDFDGIANHLDRCPGTPRGAEVDSRGCPRDDDNDGVANYMDECPGTPRGVSVDNRGCPQAGETLLVLNDIKFAFDSSTLDASSRARLDQVAQMLEQQNVRIDIVGHTDSTGAEAYNQSLSERRAQAVRSYLLSKGIDSARLSSSGRGESSPVASNDTPEGRTTNRRVEFVVIE